MPHGWSPSHPGSYLRAPHAGWHNYNGLSIDAAQQTKEKPNGFEKYISFSQQNTQKTLGVPEATEK